MSKSSEQRVDYALEQLIERTVPNYPEDDDAALDERIDDALAFAREVIETCVGMITILQISY